MVWNVTLNAPTTAMIIIEIWKEFVIEKNIKLIPKPKPVTICT